MKKIKNEREMHDVDMGQALFGETLIGINGKPRMIRAFVEPGKFTPDDLEGFIPDKHLCIDIATAWMMGRPLKLTGDSGCGKSEHIHYVANKLNWDLIVFACSNGTYDFEFLGSHKLRGGDTVFVDGPVTTGYRIGAVVLLDEYDHLLTGVTQKLNRVTDISSRLTLEENDFEVLGCKEGFGLFATANTKGFGDTNGMHGAAQSEDAAAGNRMLSRDCTYPKLSAEAQIIKNAVPAFANPDLSEVVDGMLKTTHFIRHAVRQGLIDVPFSTRTLIDWARGISFYNDSNRAFSLVYYDKLKEESQKMAVKKFYLGGTGTTLIPFSERLSDSVRNDFHEMFPETSMITAEA